MQNKTKVIYSQKLDLQGEHKYHSGDNIFIYKQKLEKLLFKGEDFTQTSFVIQILDKCWKSHAVKCHFIHKYHGNALLGCL